MTTHQKECRILRHLELLGLQRHPGHKGGWIVCDGSIIMARCNNDDDLLDWLEGN